MNIEVTNDDFVIPPSKGKNRAASSSSTAHTQPTHHYECLCIEVIFLLTN